MDLYSLVKAGKMYRYKLEFKITRDTLLSMFFENDSLLKDLKRTI